MDTPQTHPECDPEISAETGAVDGTPEKPWLFKKGHSGNPGGKPKDPDAAGGKPAEILRDMRAVYRQDESKDRTPGQRSCREFFKKDSAAFLKELSRLEAAHRSGKGDADPEERDDGAARA